MASPTACLTFPWEIFRLLFHSGFVAPGFDFHVKYSADRSFIGGCWVSRIFKLDLSGFFFQIRLSPTRTDAAALCPFPLALLHPAASILNSLGGYNTYLQRTKRDTTVRKTIGKGGAKQ
jgi:hypothetical protein